MVTSQQFKNTLWVLLIVTLTSVVLVVKADPSILTLKTTGSFEYIRHGERLINKGNYKDALRWYEKAHRSSPDSDIILSYLVWAYSAYGIRLIDAGQTAPAIYYLTRARQLKDADFTILNLAIAYARRGLSESEQGKMYEAVKDFAKARLIVGESARAAEGLAIYLYNAAVPLFKANRHDQAVFVLHESLLVGESARAHELIGEIAYRAGRLDEVTFSWARALSLDPHNASLQERSVRLARELELARSERRTDAAHFEIRVDGKIQADPVLIRTALDAAYRRAGETLRFYPADKTIVYLYTDDDFRALFKMPSTVRAFYDGTIKIPVPAASAAADDLTGSLIHEYTHAVLSAMTNNNCTAWLHEGVALLVQYGEDDTELCAAVSGLGDLSGVTLDSLADSFAAGTLDRPGLARDYVVSYSIVKYIVDRFGMKALRGILARIKTGQHIANAIDDQLLMPEEEFERRWRKHVAEKAEHNTNRRS